jgi:endonuclease VIII
VPEGDTIHRAATSLSRALVGQELSRFEAPRLHARELPRAGERIDDVVARGKHLLIRWSGDLTLHTHLRMNGSWHLYRPDERWRKTPGAMVVTIETATLHAVCFSAPVVEMLSDAELARHPVLAALGPDLCLADTDLDAVTSRLDMLDPSTEIGVALLDQRVACGIGNVYRSEVAWSCRIDPFRPLHDLDPTVRGDLYETASRLMRANLGTSRRTTIATGLAVYDRARRACPRCATTIETGRQGEQARSVWWCPGCQR